MCRAIAAGLPEYFIADDLDEIERAAETGNCWIADLQERPTAFTIVDRRAVTVAEVAWMATDEKSADKASVLRCSLTSLRNCPVPVCNSSR
jgi:hypothetical protein